MKNLSTNLRNKFEEITDMASRGLLSNMYISAWEDVMKIVDKYGADEYYSAPIMLLANDCHAQLRMWTQNGITWSASIRPHSRFLETEIIIGVSYNEMEHKTREYLKKLHKKEIRLSPSVKHKEDK